MSVQIWIIAEGGDIGVIDGTIEGERKLFIDEDSGERHWGKWTTIEYFYPETLNDREEWVWVYDRRDGPAYEGADGSKRWIIEGVLQGGERAADYDPWTGPQ